MSVHAKPEVFIIESLDFDDEDEKRFEGKLISEMLALSGKQCKYYYLRTRRELEEVLQLFSQSGYRYLHISCHGGENKKTLHTTLDAIPFDDLEAILKPHLRERRLFLSACSVANNYLAKRLMSNSGCYSILGPRDDIQFNDAAILWASLYHVMFSADETAMKHSILSIKAKEVANMFRVHLNYIRRDNKATSGYKLFRIAPAKETGASTKKPNK
jgi:hypothetical protein